MTVFPNLYNHFQSVNILYRTDKPDDVEAEAQDDGIHRTQFVDDGRGEDKDWNTASIAHREGEAHEPLVCPDVVEQPEQEGVHRAKTTTWKRVAFLSKGKKNS